MINISLTSFSLSDIVTTESINQRCKQFNSFFPLSIENGGTGATTMEQARKNLGIYGPEVINFSGTDATITLAKSIKNYSYVRVYYADTSNAMEMINSTYFSTDVIASTAMHSLTITKPYSYYGDNWIIIISALARFSASGLTISLERNGGIVKSMDNGQVRKIPWGPIGSYKISIISIIGYR